MKSKINASRFLFVTLIMGAFGSANAAWGAQERGGGNDIGLEFATYARSAVNEFANAGLRDATAVRVSRLSAALRQAKIVVVDKDLVVNIGQISQKSVAVNTPSQDLIEVNAGAWSELHDDRIRRALALHELESLIGEESTGDYKISGSYLNRIGYKLPVASKMNSAVTVSPTDNTNGNLSSPRVEYRSFTETNSSYAYNVKTNQEVPYIRGDFPGVMAVFRDEGKMYTLTSYKKITGDYDVRINVGSSLVGDIDSGGIQKQTLSGSQLLVDSQGVDFEVFDDIETETRKTGDTISSYDLDGNELYENIYQQLPDGRSIQNYVQSRAIMAGDIKLVSFTRFITYSQLFQKDFEQSLPKILVPRLRAFAELHGRLLKFKEDVEGCQTAGPAAKACDDLKAQILDLESERDHLWSTIVQKSDFTPLVRQNQGGGGAVYAPTPPSHTPSKPPSRPVQQSGGTIAGEPCASGLIQIPDPVTNIPTCP